MSKVRCGKCKNYFDKNDMTKMSIQYFCSGCFSPFVSLPQQSPKRIAEKTLRDKVVERAMKRDERCQGPAGGLPGKCGGPLDPHEIVARSQKPGGHLEIDNVIMLCRLHHTMVTDDPKLGFEMGLVKHFYE